MSRTGPVVDTAPGRVNASQAGGRRRVWKKPGKYAWPAAMKRNPDFSFSCYSGESPMLVGGIPTNFETDECTIMTRVERNPRAGSSGRPRTCSGAQGSPMSSSSRCSWSPAGW
jgi:hypothetical protein